MINPNMGSSLPESASTSLADALFPRVRQRVLALLYGNPDRSFFSNELIALAQSGTGAVQRELLALAQAGLLTVSAVGNQKHYQANRTSPVFAELRGLILKTSGVADVLRAALVPLAARIDAAFVYGSVAKQEDTAASDVDVLVIADDLAYAELFAALEPAAATLGRKVNPTLYAGAEWARRVHKRNAFATRVLAQPKFWLIGSDESLHAVAA